MIDLPFPFSAFSSLMYLMVHHSIIFVHRISLCSSSLSYLSCRELIVILACSVFLVEHRTALPFLARRLWVAIYKVRWDGMVLVDKGDL